MFHIYVNGNALHDPKGDEKHEPLSFATAAEGEDKADALHTDALERFKRGRLRRFARLAPRRDAYIVASEPPPSFGPEPEPAPEQAPEA